MPLHIGHMKEGLIPLPFAQPNPHISTGSLCLSWHVTGAGVGRTELGTQWLFMHLVQSLQGDWSISYFSPSQKRRETRATGASDLLHLHSTSDMETHSPWHLVCHWKKVNTGTQTFWYFSFLEPLKLLGKKTKSHKAFHQRAPLEHKFYFQQPIYPRPSFDRYEVTIPLANPKGISWAITSCFHLEPRTQERFIS